MNIFLITESREEIVIEEMFRSGVISEDALSILDNAVEIIGGAAGLVPGVGDLFADIPLVIKNLIQGDYLGAALFGISAIPEPTDITDAVGKTLRTIQKLAESSGQEDRINRMIEWLIEKIPGGEVATYPKKMWTYAKANLAGLDNKLGSAKADGQEGKAIGVMDKVSKYIGDNIGKMEEALFGFLDLIGKRQDKLQNVTAGSDAPDMYVDDLANKIKENYHRLMKTDSDSAIRYKNKVLNNAKKKPEIMGAYIKIFGKELEI